MHRSEGYDRTDCIDCGGEVSDARERAYALDGGAVLCFECAVRRGGSYDEAADRWERAPDLGGLSLGEAERGRVWK